jgi:8-oxo-dGTP pyrophosphatase MutT (NUDIX family)
MNYSKKIYYNNKPLVLTNDASSYIEHHKIAEGYLKLTGAFSRNFRLALEHLGKIRSLGVILEDLSKEALERELSHSFTPIDAGGGVVQNENGQVLMIYRRGKWDLPKGKRDDGEDIATCALREVTEETGLQKIALGNLICNTYHIYNQHGEQLLKQTTWYHMKASKKETLAPQKEENIQEAKWLDEKDLGVKIYKSYEAIREVLYAAGMKW